MKGQRKLRQIAEFKEQAGEIKLPEVIIEDTSTSKGIKDLNDLYY